jgi:O-antigen ligase
MSFKIFIIFIFTGSVFLTSSKFINTLNAPKLYFVIVSLLTFIAFKAICSKDIKTITVANRKTLYYGVYLVCFIQACYGFLQFFNLLSSNNPNFQITGSFENPAGFASVLAIGFPIGLFLIPKAKKVESYLVFTSLATLGFAVFLSGSRVGILSIFISSVVFFFFQKNSWSRLKQFKFYKLFSVLAVMLVIIVVFYFYHQKKDSADGRFLIWKVTSEMIIDKPLFGHGYGSFQLKYMNYQADYFKKNPNSDFAILADDVKQPFNEFIKVAVEFGIVGLFISLLLIVFLFWKIINSKNEDRHLVISGLIAFLVLACFSYPLYYIAVWILLANYLSTLLPTTTIEIKNSKTSALLRSTIIIACFFFIFQIIIQIRSEIKWKSIAMKSLAGNTEEMLPEYEKLYSKTLKQNPFFLYNYGAELNFVGRYNKSIKILSECQTYFNDYDTQMLLADNYYHIGKTAKSLQTYQIASNMIPCRFLPLYQIFQIYKDSGKKNIARKYAKEIVNKKVKIPSLVVNSIKEEASEYLKEN